MAAGTTFLQRYFPDLTEEQSRHFDALGPLYREWNDRINVISRKDIDNLYERHVLHALGIAKVVQFRPGTRVLDVGTGGGFPGLPLAILFPETKFHLVDSIGKKVRVVDEVAGDLGLTNVEAEQARAEQLKGSYDFVVSRAVTRLPIIWSWISKRIRGGGNHELRNGLLYLKGGDIAEEVKDIARPIRQFELSDFFEEPFFESKKVIYIQR